MPLFTPRLPLIGTNGTVTVSTPLLDLSQTWNNVAVGFTGVKISITNTASAGNSYLFDVLMGGTSRLNVQSNGTVNIAGDMAAGGALYTGISGSRVVMFGSADGVLRLSNAAVTDFGRLQFGGTTSAFPAIKRNGADLHLRLADDTGYTSVRGGAYIFALGSRIGENADGTLVLLNNANTDFGRLQFGGTTNAYPALKRVGGQLNAVLADDSALTQFRAVNYAFGFGSKITDNADGVLQLVNNAGTDFTRLQFGGTTSSFPALKRNGVDINARLADDSGDAGFTAGNFRAVSYVKTNGTTVAGLPSAATVGAGARSYVTDATLSPSGNFGQPVTGGGANGTVVWSNGSGWLYG